MRVGYYYFKEWPQAVSLLEKHAPQAERVYTGPDDYGYWREFTRRWGQGDDLVIIEQDVGIHETVIPQFEECSSPWCEFPWGVKYAYHTRWLGCVKFSADIQQQVKVQHMRCPGSHLDGSSCDGAACVVPHPAGGACFKRHRDCEFCGVFCWEHLDAPIFEALRLVAGLQEPCLHLPAVNHFHYDR